MQDAGGVVWNEYLAYLLNITEDRVSKIISSLEKKSNAYMKKLMDLEYNVQITAQVT